MPLLKCALITGILSVLTLEVLARLYLYNRKRKSAVILNDIIFFTDKSACSVDHLFRKVRCPNSDCGYSNLRRVIEYIDSTKVSLDICIYIMSCYDLAKAILKVHRRGKRVRIIADASQSGDVSSPIGKFRKHGITVRMKSSPFLMHHKFFIIDGQVLLTGSCNWTMQAITGNWDQVVITSDPNIVRPFHLHFSELWKEFSE